MGSVERPARWPQREAAVRQRRARRTACLGRAPAYLNAHSPAGAQRDASARGCRPTFLIEPVPAGWCGVELGAIRICYVVAVIGRSPCWDEAGSRGVETRWRRADLSERSWTDYCTHVQQMHRCPHRQAIEVAPEQREVGTCGSPHRLVAYVIYRHRVTAAPKRDA